MLQSKLISALLIVAALPLLISASVPTQSYVTVTSTIPTSVTVTTTHSVTSTATSFLYSPFWRTPLSGSRTLSAVPQEYGCNWDDVHLVAQSGQVISLKFNSNNQVDVYVLSSDEFDSWMNRHLCAPADTLASGKKVTSESLNVVIPENGMYHMLFENSSHDHAAVVYFEIQIIGSASTSLARTVTTTNIVLFAYFTTTETSYISSTNTAVINTGDNHQLANQNLLLGWFTVVLSAYFLYWITKRRSRGESKKSEGETIPY